MRRRFPASTSTLCFGTLPAAGLLAAVLLPCGPGFAQSFSVTALATPQPRVVATGISTSTQTLPVGKVTAPRQISVSASSALLWDVSTATVSVAPGPSEVVISAGASRQSITSGMPSTSTADGALEVDLSGPVQGSLWIGYHMYADAPPTLRVDVGADGVLELDFTTAGRLETGLLAVPVASAGPVRTIVSFHFSSAVPGSSVYSGADLTIGFVPNDSIVFRRSEPGCAPQRPEPVLTGQDTRLPLQHRLDFRVDGALPNAFAMLVFGTDIPGYTPIQLPPGCVFLVEPVAWIALPTDAAGRATFRFDLFRPFPPATIYMQALPFDFSPYVISSNRLDVLLVP